MSHRGSPRILEWVAYLFSSGSSQPRNQTEVSCIAGGYSLPTELLGKPLVAEYIMQNVDWMKHKLESRLLAGRNINNLRYVDDTTLMAESEEELQSLLMKVKERSEKAGLKFSIQNTKIMVASPITSWQIEGKQNGNSDRLFSWAPKMADGDCSHEIKICLLHGKKAMSNLDSILKSRDITLPTKVHIVKAMVFPIVMYIYESWAIKNAERRRIDAFELWCWRRLLESPWTARRSNQLILKEISPEYSLESLMLKLQHLGHLMRRTDSLEKTLMLGRAEGGRRKG